MNLLFVTVLLLSRVPWVSCPRFMFLSLYFTYSIILNDECVGALKCLRSPNVTIDFVLKQILSHEHNEQCSRSSVFLPFFWFVVYVSIHKLNRTFM